MADYLDLPFIVSLIFLIIPFTAWFLGVLTRIKDGHYVAAILRFFLGGHIIWIIDILVTILNNCKITVWRLLKV